MSRLPAHCPACGGPMLAIELRCSSCDTSVQGQYQPCPVCRLDPQHRELFDLFLEARGNLKQVQRRLGISYPTVRQRIDAMFQELEQAGERPDPMEVLRLVRSGELTVEEAEELLRGS